MRRPDQRVLFQKIQERPEKRRPHIVRWTVDGKPFQESHATRALASRYRRRLETAVDHGERFDPHSGRPESWAPHGAETPIYDWARKWLAHQWGEIAPRTRTSYTEAMARFVPLAVSKHATEPPEGLWEYLDKALRPEADIDANDPRERWLRRWGLTLGDLSKDVLTEVDRKLGLGAQGQQLGAETAGRFRKNAKACVRWAVELEKIPADPWPQQPRGRNRRKANRIIRSIDIRRLPNPEAMDAVIDALPNRTQPAASRRWQVMTAVGYCGGLRPSETLYLRRSSIHLPHLPGGGWCLIEVQEADDGEDNPADPKTGYRPVPGPPALTLILHAWISEHDLGPNDLLFRTENGTKPALNNWGRALRRACREAGVKPISPYDLRHSCATTWLQAGVPLGEVARRLGHSVQTLVARYIQALTGDEQTANERIEQAFDRGTTRWAAVRPAPTTQPSQGPSRARPANSAKSGPIPPNK